MTKQKTENQETKKKRNTLEPADMIIRSQGYDHHGALIKVYFIPRVIIINRRKIAFQDILGYNIDTHINRTLNHSTPALIGRGILGGLTLGPWGALACMATTEMQCHDEVSFSITLHLNKPRSPQYIFWTSDQCVAQQVASVLDAIQINNFC